MFYVFLCNICYIQDMTVYHAHGVKLSEGQKSKLSKAINDKLPLTLRLSSNQLSGPHQLMLKNSDQKDTKSYEK